MIITFTGHSKIDITNELTAQIKITIEKYLDNEIVIFYCGGYGTFDIACAKIVKELKTAYSNILSVFVTPYLNEQYLASFNSSPLYDSILYPELEHTPPRFAISKRNKHMIDCADIVIAYIDHDWGGAYKTYQYAKKKNKTVINLADKDF